MKTKTVKIFLSIMLALCFAGALTACENEFGHQHSYTKEVTEPTCIESGYTTYICSCGDSYVSDYVAPDDTKHAYDWVEGKDADCYATGIKGHYRCPYCGNNFDEDKNELSGEEIIIPARHTYKWVEEKSPECNEVGTKAHYVCEKCEKLFNENKEEVSASKLDMPKAEHSYKNGECENCHAKKPSEGLDYALASSYYKVSIGTCIDTDIVIPAYYNGKPVKYVDEEGFSGSDITSVTIENGIEYIYQNAFKDCASLKSVTLPDSLKGIFSSAFENCSELKEIALPEKLESIKFSTFKNCDALKSIVIPDSVTELGNSAFEDCDELKAVTFGKKIDTIGKNAFYNCVSLRKIEIPESVKYLEENAFENCTSLTEVTINGALETFREYAFRNCSKLKEVTIGEGTTYIGTAFSGCYKLERVTLPSSLISLPEKAFESGLKEIIYNGTVDQWAEIKFESNHDPLNYANILYINGKPLTDVTFTTATKISPHAFEGCASLTSVTIPKSVTEIGNTAFENCSSLKSITVAEDNENYCSVDGILYNKQKTEIVYVPLAIEGSVTIPDSIKEIGYREFYDCTFLTNVTIPDSVTSIEDYAFSDCESLINVIIPDNVTKIGTSAFYGCSSLKEIKLPKDIKGIPYQIFAGCSSLINIDIPYGVTDIEDRAFDGCGSLISVSIPSSVTSINERAFTSCYKVIEVFNNSKLNISEYITAEYYNTNESTKIDKINDYLFITAESGTNYLLGYVGDQTELVLPSDYNGKEYKIYPYAFWNRKSLKSVTIPEKVTYIGDKAFDGCESLISVTIPDSVTSIGESAFSGCESLTSVTISEKVTYIGESAFSGCSSLTSVTIPEKVRYIEKSVFSGCESLTSVIIPDSVISIGESAFYGCSSLTSVTIPKSVTSINSNAFYRCVALKDVYYTGTIDQWVQIEFYDTKSNPLSTARNFYIDSKRVTEAVIGAEKISSYAFYNYLPLTRVTLYNTVTEINYGAFSGCNKLVEVSNYSSSFDVEKGSYENGCVGCYAEYVYNRTNENTKIDKINDYLFITAESGTDYLLGYVGNQTELVLPNDYNGKEYKIHSYAFYGFGELKSITIPSSVTSIGEYAFYNCDSLTNIIIPDSVTEIGEYAFYDCDSLISVTLGSGIKIIEKDVFYDCDSLTSIIIPDSVAEIKEYAFFGCRLINVVIMNDTVEIADDAFVYGEITNVYYGGTKTEWKEIEKNSDNNALFYATIYYYSETAPIDRIDYCDYWHYEKGVPAVWSNTEE